MTAPLFDRTHATDYLALTSTLAPTERDVDAMVESLNRQLSSFEELEMVKAVWLAQATPDEWDNPDYVDFHTSGYVNC